ncbi:pyroglutamyl peptidase [Kitasatospora sp. NPDC059408]|uniref:pyroglutamyl peptidase n=1 Tax=Kitasatospora sp. NPDC059408 TaxID=3346823 RepID=UPI00368B22D4
MMRTSRTTRPVPKGALALLGTVTALAALLGPGAGPAVADGGCRTDVTVTPDQEQARLSDPRTAALVDGGGFGDFVRRFPAALCTARTAADAQRLLRDWGEALWTSAVDRAQGRRPAGTLPARDDRPLYWTRVAMSLQLAQWQPGFPADRAALRRGFEDASRGLVDNGFRGTQGVRRYFVSGFDPFGLDSELRGANPSGSAALQLDGRQVTLTDGNRAEIRTVVLPVRYADFDQGVVDRAFAPRLGTGPRAADLITTVSQGYPGLFTLEAWAGRARSADPYPDNLDALGGGSPDHPADPPGLAPGAEFIATSLPTAAMTTVQQPYPVKLNTDVTEIPVGGTQPVHREDGPTPGSRSVEGGGGGYLSNEVAYRSNLLRLALAPQIPGGHLHTPVLTGLPADPAQLTAPDFEHAEAAITGEVLDVLRHTTG